ncbi:MAG: sigma-70 family RNA polymerase sigma factor [Verrucomicrobium sp.]|nr:sigma-70 family RNA polymerase sigma factor [Verrucomicrobium sp.]
MQAGTERAFDALVERYQERIFHFVCRSVANRSDAEEIAQEAFVRAYFHLATFRPDALFSTWLFRIAVNLCRDHLRRQGSSRVLRTESVSASRSSPDEPRDREFPSPGPDPAAAAVQRENLAIVEREIAGLPPDLKSPLILTAVEGLTQEEAGRLLGLSAKAVEMKVYRARKVLSKRLDR